MTNIAINAHLLSSKTGYRTAGIHGYIDGVLRHLGQANAHQHQLTAFVGGANTRAYPNITMRPASFDTESPLKRIAWEQAIQPFALGRGGFDLYHAMAFVSPLRLKVPSVVTVYDLSFVHYPERLTAARRLYLRWFTPLACKRAARVIAISHSTAHDLTATLDIPADKIDIAAPGYDRETFHPLANEQIEAFRRAKNLPRQFWLFIGTIEPRKNLATLFEAYAQLPAHNRPKLVIGGGKGWDTEPIFAAVKQLGLSDDVSFVGFIPTEELALWYNCADVFIYPSVFEGFGLPVLEAMACGTPVICSDVSSLPEVAGAAGITVSPHDVAGWCEALTRARDDDEWRASAREQGFIEASRYGWGETAYQTMMSYNKVLRTL